MNTDLILFALMGVALCGTGRRSDRGDGGGERKGGPDRERGGGMGPLGLMGLPPPPYLKSVNEEARREFIAIITKTDLTLRQQKEAVSQWARKFDIEEQVEDFNANITRFKGEIRQNLTDLIFALPSVAQQFSAVLDNEDQTAAEKGKIARGFEGGKSSARYFQVFSVLKFAMGQLLPRHGPSKEGRMQSRGRKGMRGGQDEKRPERGRSRGSKGTTRNNMSDREWLQKPG
ncbi:hypothetical protein COOONC_22375 [Cooperia oncophora]